jgi:glycosyltransferase involved in cell wall biosynthesis
MIGHQARGLAALGYRVRVVSGKGTRFHENIETFIDPLLGSAHPDILEVKRELDAGSVTSAFEVLTHRIVDVLRNALAECEVCIAHNVLSLNKNLAFTAALARLHQEGQLHLLAWCSDLAWTNPQYLPELHDGYPWTLLRQPWSGARYVTISDSRRIELAALLQVPSEAIAVITPGISPDEFFRWTPATTRLVDQLGLLEADGLLLLPARLTRRKNIALALRVLAALRHQSEQDFRLIVTGPPGPHNPANPGYLGELLELRHTLGLNDAAHFLYAYGDSPDHPLVPDDDTIADLYRMVDALFFPSTQEGFGIPILEAGLVGLPIFCADIPPLRGTAQQDAVYFDPIPAWSSNR